MSVYDLNSNTTNTGSITDEIQVKNQIMNSPTVICSGCNSKLFVENVILKKISLLYTGTGKDELVPIPVYVCTKCGKILDYFTEKPNFKKLYGEIEEDKSDIKDNLIK